MDLICQKFTKLVHLYVADALSQRQREAMCAHLEICERCRQALAEAQTVAASLRQAAPPRAPVGLAAGIKAELRLRVAHRQANAIPARVIGSPAFLAVSSSLVVGAILTFIVLTQVVMPGIPMDEKPVPTPSGSMIAVVPPIAVVPGSTVVMAATPADVPAPTVAAVAWRSQDLHVKDISSRTVAANEPAGITVRTLAARAVSRSATSGAASTPIASFAREETGTFAVASDARLPREGGEAQLARLGSVTTLDSVESNRDAAANRDPAASSDPVANEVVGALIADLVVDRYVHDELVRKETTLLASTPTATGAAFAPTSTTKDH